MKPAAGGGLGGLVITCLIALAIAACSTSEPSATGDSTLGQTPIESGAALVDDLGCLVCHAQNSQLGPAFEGIWGQARTNTAGTMLSVDAAYIRESVLFPERVVVPGFRGQMPGYIIDDVEIEAIAAFIESLS